MIGGPIGHPIGGVVHYELSVVAVAAGGATVTGVAVELVATAYADTEIIRVPPESKVMSVLGEYTAMPVLAERPMVEYPEYRVSKSSPERKVMRIQAAVPDNQAQRTMRIEPRRRR